MFDLTDKNAFITGAASGIGAAVAAALREAGARVSSFDLQPLAQPPAEDDGCHYQGSVVDEAQLSAALRATHERFGPLDVLINNAGIAGTEAEIAATELDDFDRVLRINLIGVLLGMKHGLPLMRDGASVINTASLAATATMPGYTGYSVSKAGVVKLTQQAALEVGARGIRVNAICPGTTLTPMEPKDGPEARLSTFTTALGRPAKPSEQVGTYLFLASDASRYVTGQSIHVDGGWLHGLTPALCDRILV